MSLALLAFPAFLTFDRPLFGALAVLGYVLLAFAVAESIEERFETLGGPVSMAWTALVGFFSVVLFYVVDLAKDSAKSLVKLDVTRTAPPIEDHEVSQSQPNESN